MRLARFSGACPLLPESDSQPPKCVPLWQRKSDRRRSEQDHGLVAQLAVTCGILCRSKPRIVGMATNRMQRRLTTILAADVAGYSRLAGTDEEGTVSRLRALQQEVIDPSSQWRTPHQDNGRRQSDRVRQRRGRCALRQVQSKIAVRDIDVASDRRIEFRVGIHLDDVIVESDGDLMGDGVNIGRDSKVSRTGRNLSFGRCIPPHAREDF